MTEVVVGRQKFTIRSLRRKEIKSLRAEGYPLETIGTMEDYQKRDEGLDRIFALACEGGDPDELSQGEALELWTKVVSETYGSEERKKKSQSQPLSTSEKDASTATSAEKRASRRKGTARKSTGKNG